MILSTTSGDFPVPEEVAIRLPAVPHVPNPAEADYEDRRRAFGEWLAESPEHAISYERVRRWHLLQDDLAATAVAAGRPFTVTRDGLE